MADNTLFDKQEQQTDQSQQSSLFSINGRAYDANSAKTKIENADSFIETLKAEKTDLATQLEAFKQENERLRSQANKQANLEEALNMLKQGQQTPPEATPSIDVEALKAQLLKESQSLTMNTVAQLEKQRMEEANFQQSLNAAKRVFGLELGDKLAARGKELGMQPDAIDQMAKSNPKMFSELFIPKVPSQQSAPSGQYVNNSQVQSDIATKLPDWHKPEYWSTQSKAKSMIDLEGEVSKLIGEGKLDPTTSLFF